MQFVHSYDEEYPYGEEQQERACKFAFARLLKTGKVKVLHYPALCRDFLSDTLAWKAKEPAYKGQVYGYDYTGYVDPKKVSLYFTDTRPSTLVDNVTFLKALEKEIGLETETTVHLAKDGGTKELYITGSKWWMQTTVHFSFYTYLLRQLSEEGVVKTWQDFKPGKLGKDLFADGKLQKLHLLLAKLKVTDVAGCHPEYRGDKYVVHDYNGFRSQFTRPEWTVYGEQLNGLQTP